MLPGGIIPSGAATTGGGADDAGAAEADADAAVLVDGATDAETDAAADPEGLAEGDPPAVSPPPRKRLPRMNPMMMATSEMSPIASTGRPFRGVVRAARYALMRADYRGSTTRRVCPRRIGT